MEKNGFLVPPWNSRALAERMTWILENRKACSEMGKESRKLAEKRFDVRGTNRLLMHMMELD